MIRWASREFTSWGRVHKTQCLAARPERNSDLVSTLTDSFTMGGSMLAYGAGRSYGDVALNSGGRSVITTRLNRLLEFDPLTGLLVAETGVTFGEILATFLPLGFVPPVTPGTGFATLGGGVANDVHGKNHHVSGSLGQHVEWLDLRLPSGESRRLARVDSGPLWRATIGGLGLTGLIERIALRLKRVPSNALMVRKRQISNLSEFLIAFAEHAKTDYVVGWVDALARGSSLGRGILETARPADIGIEQSNGIPWRMPFDLPSFGLNSTTVRAFNALYWRKVHSAGLDQTMHYAKFLYPLDAIQDWNRIYGKRGFHQFQSLIPYEAGETAIRKLLECAAQSGQGSFLAVLKAMGERGSGYMSFPAPGYTLALDFPNSPGVTTLLTKLQHITADHGGRVYLAKDDTLQPGHLPAMYPELESYCKVLAEIDPHGRMDSDLSRRLGIRKSRT